MANQERNGRTGDLYIAGYAATFLTNHMYSDDVRKQNRTVIRKHLIPAFERRAMKLITAADVDGYIRQKEKELSGAMVAKLRSIATTMWNDALRDGIVTGNPWVGSKSKPHEAKVKPRMTPDQFSAILRAVEANDEQNHRGTGYALLVRCLGETGLRWSEATRLVPSDVVGNFIHVRKSKTRKGIRKISIRPELADDLRASLPFRTPHGHALDSDVHYKTFRRDCWNPGTRRAASAAVAAARTADLPYPLFHGRPVKLSRSLRGLP